MNKGKKAMSLILALCIIVNLVIPGVAAAEAEVLTITSAEELLALCGGEAFAGANGRTIVLAGDINMEGLTMTPIGGTTAFTGTFDGQGFAIRNLTISGSENATGLFGHIGAEGKVQDLALENVTVTGGNNTGAIAGVLSGSVLRCAVAGSVTGGRYTGGIAGLVNPGTIDSCMVDVSVSGSDRSGALFGGCNFDCSGAGSPLTGVVPGSMHITGNLVMGTVIAGAYSGAMFGELGYSKTASLGAINGNVVLVRAMNSTGGPYGPVYGWWTTSHSATAGQDNYYRADMVLSGPGTQVAEREDLNLYAVPEYALWSQAFYEDLQWDFDTVWAWSEGLGHPVLRYGSYTEESVIHLGSAEDVQALWAMDASELVRAHIVLDRDIDLAGVSLAPLAQGSAFEGVLDGKGHVLKNLTISGESCTGLVGYVGQQGIIRNLGLEHVTVTGGGITGAVAGVMTGLVERCYVTGTVTAGNYTGAIAGMLHAGTIRNCWSDCAINAGSCSGALFGETNYNCTGTPLAGVLEGDMNVINNLTRGSVSGVNHVGGLFGELGNSKTSAIGSITGNVAWVDSVTVSGTAQGAVYGWFSSGRTLDDSDENYYYDAMVLTGSGEPVEVNANDFTPKTAGELGTQESYEGLGWDFVNVWTWSEAMGHPVLAGVGPRKPETVQIATAQDLLDLWSLSGGKYDRFYDANILLTADIDMTGTVITPLFGDQPFQGTFDGQGHVISNLTVNGTGISTGLIGWVDTMATIRDLSLENVKVTGQGNTGTFAGTLTGSLVRSCAVGSVTGDGFTGGAVGMLHAGMIENCWLDLAVTGGNRTGGLFGGADWDARGGSTLLTGRITDKAMKVSNNLVLGTVTGRYCTGGMLGDVGNSKTSTLVEPFAGNVVWLDSVSAETSDTYFGPVHGWWSAGRDWGNLENVYWEGIGLISAAEPNTNAADFGFTTRTAGELGTQAVYEALGWDFETVWVWDTGYGHPVLQGVTAPGLPVEYEQLTPASLVSTFAGDPMTTRAFTWYTDPSVSGTLVQAVAQADYTGEESFASEKAIFAEGTCTSLQTDSAGTMRHIHQAELTGLMPGTVYVCRAGDGTNWSDVFPFTTQAWDADSFTFFSMTDTQASSINRYAYYASVLEDATTRYPDAAFILHGGDVVQENYVSHYDRIYALTAAYTPSLPSMVTPGNHEMQKDSFDYVPGLVNFKTHYLFPDNGPAGAEQTTYSFDYGDAHIAVINAYALSTSQNIQWLREDMNASDKPWKIVSIHVGPYNYYGAGSQAMINAMDELGIDLVNFGHNHVFLRSAPIKNGVIGTEGTVYYSSGCAGNSAGSGGEAAQEWFEAYSNTSGDTTYGAITVTRESLTITTHSVPNVYPDAEPQIIDTYTITKPDPEVTPPVALELTYSGALQTLASPGSAEGGSLVYSLDGESWSDTVPQASEAGDHTLWYKVLADSDHKDTQAHSITVNIAPMDISGAEIILGEPLTYNGSEQTMQVRSVTANGLAATFDISGNTATGAGAYTLTVTGTGNFTGTARADWSIEKAEYEIRILEPEFGTILANRDTAFAGEIITVTMTPEEGYEIAGVTVTDTNGNDILPNWISGDQYTFTMPEAPVFVEAQFGTVFVNPFEDVFGTDYYYDPVMWAVTEGITAGTTVTTFEPNESCTRAQVVTFLWRAAGKPVVDGENPFADVPESGYYYHAVLWAVAEGITVGTSDTEFSPDEPCTRAQIVTFLYRYDGCPEVETDHPFVDLAEGEYYIPAVLWAYENGITRGDAVQDEFNPDGTCLRCQIVTFLYRYLA